MTFIIFQESASDAHFQAFLLDGLVRWNIDRGRAAVRDVNLRPLSYSDKLTRSANGLSHRVYGIDLDPSYRSPLPYSGERIGVEYLYGQTGKDWGTWRMEEEDDDIVEMDDPLDEGFVGEAAEEEENDPTISSDGVSILLAKEQSSSSHLRATGKSRA